MSLLEQKKLGEESGKKFRLVVRSAEEAVRVIREKLGDNAKVISVRQVGGEGLKRFISSPKLEVIAQVLEDLMARKILLLNCLKKKIPEICLLLPASQSKNLKIPILMIIN